MCGITGFLDTSRSKSSEQLTLIARRMATSLSHRGPDDDGVWVDQNTGIAFGHRRLSIIDLSPMGAQPMHSASGRYVITFNGEIYNFKALRAGTRATRRNFPRSLRHRNHAHRDRPLGRRGFAEKVQRHVRVRSVGPRRANDVLCHAIAPAKSRSTTAGPAKRCSLAPSSRRSSSIPISAVTSTAARLPFICATTTSRHRTQSTRASTNSQPGLS